MNLPLGVPAQCSRQTRRGLAADYPCILRRCYRTPVHDWATGRLARLAWCSKALGRPRNLVGIAGLPGRVNDQLAKRIVHGEPD